MNGRYLLATRSAGKLRELRRLFSSAGVPIVDLHEAGVVESAAEADLEQFETFEENALAKARHFYAVSKLPTLADDSGLEVRGLGGRPGVRSKRWSARPGLEGQALDQANNETLLASLPEGADRAARYVCVAAFVDGSRELVRRGECAGEILRAPRGSGGFGYDPYFESSELGRSMAELTVDEKATISHRARAFRALLLELHSAG